jgi:hypothetical protein
MALFATEPGSAPLIAAGPALGRNDQAVLQPGHYTILHRRELRVYSSRELQVNC